MSDAIRNYLPWLLSIITIYMTVLAGNKSRHAWLFGLGNQALFPTDINGAAAAQSEGGK